MFVGSDAAASRSSQSCVGVNGPPAVTGSAGGLSTDVADAGLAVGAGDAFEYHASTAASDGASPATARRGPLGLLVPGAVIVTPTAARAHRLRLAATVSIVRRLRGLGLRLNGHDVRLPAGTGRRRVVLDAADGLIVGENLLWVTIRGRAASPTVQFVVGYRDTRPLAARLQLGAGRLPAATASLRVPRTGIDRLSATLNGVPLPMPPDGGATGRLALNLAELGPIRWGANRVAVRLIMMDGRVAEWARTFRLDPSRDIAVAQVGGPAVVGQTVSLNARRSLSASAAQVQDVRWMLLRRPRLSHARLGRPDGARITLRPDVPGYYLVGLDVGCGPSSGYDMVTVAARYDEPLVPLDTIVYKNNPGRQVGVQVANDFYPDPIAGSWPPSPIQAVVLDRNTLELLDNKGYYAGDEKSLGDFLKNLPPTDLVIVTFPGQPRPGPYPSQDLPALDSTLHEIGGSLPAKWTYNTPHCWAGATDQCMSGSLCSYNKTNCIQPSWQLGGYDGGSFSVIGIPGLAVGQAWRETSVQTDAQDGEIRGYLTQGTDQGSMSDYTVINGGADHYEAVDTCAPPNCDVQIGYPGDPNYRTYPSPGPNGLQVLELDRTTLAPIVDRTVTTEADLLSALTSPGRQQKVGHVVGGIDDQRLVIIRSVGDGRLSGLGGGGPTSQAPLLQYIDELGGTPDLLWPVMQGWYKYALVGAATDLPWRNTAALESSTGIPGTPPPSPMSPGGPSRQTGRVSGVLERDPQGLYTPLSGDPRATNNSELYHVLYQPATAWPDANLPYDTEDLKSIADQLGLTPAYPDVRSAYYKNINGEPWAILKSNLENTNKVKCPSPDPSSDQCHTFEALRTELAQEFQWVSEVQSLGTNLKSPYLGNNNTTIQTVYENVKSSIVESANPPVKMRWLSIVTEVMETAADVAALTGNEELAAGFGLIAAAGALATDLMETQTDANGAPTSADTLATTANDLAAKLGEQVQTYETWVGQMQTIIVRDYEKLKTVGKGVLGDPAWAWGTNTTSDAAIALNANTAASAYSALVPAVWPAYNTKPDFQAGSLNNELYSNDLKNLACDYNGDKQGQHQHPFDQALLENQLWWTPQPPAPKLGHQAITTFQPDGSNVDQAWVFAQLNASNWAWGGGGYRQATVPLPNNKLANLTDNIYGSTSTNSNTGARQFAPVWWRDTYNPPSHTLCFGTIGNVNWWSTQYPPPLSPFAAP